MIHLSGNSASNILAIIIVILCYLNLFISPANLGGDLNFVDYQERIISTLRPYIWEVGAQNGLGGYSLIVLPPNILHFPFSAIASYFQITDAFLLHKATLLWPTLAIGLITTLYAARHLFLNLTARALFIPLYLLNPYIILLISGGQIGVAMAYAFLPAFFIAWYQLGLCIHHLRQISNLRIVLTALTFPIFLALDARLFLLGLALVTPMYLYLLYLHRLHPAPIFRALLRLALLSAVFTFLLHAHWLLPVFYLEPVRLPQGYNTTSAAEYFSFTRFAHALSWSHPSYPQNVFGKVNEIVPAALIFPMLAFLAIRLRPQKLVIYFTLVAIFASFLTKGTNEPFGQVYLWLFAVLPGFNLFRDSTKFYTLISLAYAYLISFSLGTIMPQLARHNLLTSLSHPILTFISRIPTYHLLFATTIFLISLAWWPTLAQQIRGTLAYRTYPQSYQKLQSILESDPQFGRVLWLPTRELYGYTSLTHPAVNFDLLTRTPTCHPQFCQELPRYPAGHIFTHTDLAYETDLLLQKLNQPNLEKIFRDLAIKYLVLVPDYDHTIYTHDYQPYRKLYAQYRVFLDQHPHLRQVYTADNLVLYRTINTTAFIFDRLSGQSLSYQKINPTYYQVSWNGGVGEIHISQSYDPRWQLTNGQNIFRPELTDSSTMYFRLNTDPTTYNLIYSGQEYADLGWSISQLSLLAILIYLVHQYFFASPKKSP